jgi:hypothetical protein
VADLVIKARPNIGPELNVISIARGIAIGDYLAVCGDIENKVAAPVVVHDCVVI